MLVPAGSCFWELGGADVHSWSALAHLVLSCGGEDWREGEKDTKGEIKSRGEGHIHTPLYSWRILQVRWNGKIFTCVSFCRITTSSSELCLAGQCCMLLYTHVAICAFTAIGIHVNSTSWVLPAVCQLMLMTYLNWPVKLLFLPTDQAVYWG